LPITVRYFGYGPLMPAKRYRGSIGEADRIGRRGVGLTTVTITGNNYPLIR